MPETSLALDPFAIFPGVASRIAGLGAGQPSDDATYAFFSPFVPATGSDARLSARFSGLKGTRGTLDISVSVLPKGSVIHSRKISHKRIELAAAPPDLGVSFDIATFPGASYALVGELSLDSASEASGLEIAWEAETGPLAPAFLGTTQSDLAHAALIAPGPATLGAPISQMCTAAQFEEPEFAFWTKRIDMEASRHRKLWEYVFILQSLSRYGVLRPGARALGFGVGREPLPALFAGMEIEVTATDMPVGHDAASLWHDTDQHAAAVEELRQPALCSEALFARHVRYRSVDMNAIPADLEGFDFVWSSCAFEHLGSIECGLAFVERSIACLKPGGLAVHTTELNLSSDQQTVDHNATVLFRRQDFVQLALRLIAQGQEVAPLCFDPGNTPVDQYLDLPPYNSDMHLKIAIGSFATTSFGLIVRRGTG